MPAFTFLLHLIQNMTVTFFVSTQSAFCLPSGIGLTMFMAAILQTLLPVTWNVILKRRHPLTQPLGAGCLSGAFMWPHFISSRGQLLCEAVSGGAACANRPVPSKETTVLWHMPSNLLTCLPCSPRDACRVFSQDNSPVHGSQHLHLSSPRERDSGRSCPDGLWGRPEGNTCPWLTLSFIDPYPCRI